MPVFALIVTVLVLAIMAIFLVTGITGAPYVPTLKPGLDAAFTKLYRLGKKDLLIDLGAGDGVILAAAAQHGAKALGIELNPILALIMRLRFRHNQQVSVRCRNFYHVQFPAETTVVYAFAVSLHIEPIYRKIQQEANRLGKPIFFISNAFNLKGLEPAKKVGSFYLYKISPQQ